MLSLLLYVFIRGFDNVFGNRKDDRCRRCENDDLGVGGCVMYGSGLISSLELKLFDFIMSISR